MTGQSNITISPLWWKCGWGAGAFILLLQYLEVIVPMGERRDWLGYSLIGGVAVFYLIATALMVTQMPLSAKGLTCYAFLALCYYAVWPLFDLRSAGVWIAALLLADIWLARRQVGRYRALYGLAMAWFLLCAYSLCRSLIYRVKQMSFPTEGDTLLYALPFVVGIAFVCAVLCMPQWGGRWPLASPALRRVLHVVALYVIAVPHFSIGQFSNPMALHHWKALLEPAEVVRDGGWLLVDVPSQYGFLQTLTIAILPAASAWQSLYLLNGALLTATGYLIFRVLFTRYPSQWGFFFSLLLAVSATVLVLPMGNGQYYPIWSALIGNKVVSFNTTGNPLILPSTGALRFFWIYLMAGYVAHVCLRYRRLQPKQWPRYVFAAGNALWLMGALWSMESAVFVSVIWIPVLALMAVAERYTKQALPSMVEMLRSVAWRMLQLALMAFTLLLLIAACYWASLGYGPDISMLTAYTNAYVGGYNIFSIYVPGALPCWLFLFWLMVMMCALYLLCVKWDAQALLDFAVFYAAIAGLWAAVSYYVPLSDDVHLGCTLPVMIYLTGLLLGMMPRLELPALAKELYEKSLLCLYGILLWGTASYFNPALYARDSFPIPVYADVTKYLPAPPGPLKALLDKAELPKGAFVQMLWQPYKLEEGLYLHGKAARPWLLPNTLVGYDVPLPKDTYRILAERRAARTDAQTGWVIERKEYPLDHYYWIKAVIENHYREVKQWEDKEYRLRKFERRTPGQQDSKKKSKKNPTKKK